MLKFIDKYKSDSTVLLTVNTFNVKKYEIQTVSQVRICTTLEQKY